MGGLAGPPISPAWRKNARRWRVDGVKAIFGSRVAAHPKNRTLGHSGGILVKADFVTEDALAGIHPGAPQLLAIDELLQWAVARSGRLPWRRDDPRELMSNFVWTV